MWNPFKKTVYHSPINGEIILGKQKNEKAIFAGNVTQSGGELVSMWNTVIGTLHKEKYTVKNFLLLGVGAGMIFRVVKTYYPKTNMIGIEIDPIMKQIAIKEFQWEDTKKQHIVIADAITWLQQYAPHHQFDLIAVDLFIGPLNAPKTRDSHFFHLLKKTLTKQGIVLYNSHYQKNKTHEYSRLQKTVATSFKTQTEVFFYPLNRVLLLKDPQ